MSFEPARAVLLLSGSGMLVLAIAVLAKAPGRPANRAFGALLAVRGAATLLPQLSSDAAFTMAVLQVQPFFALAIAPLALYCMASFPDSRPSRRATAWSLGVLVVAEAAYAVHHGWFQTLEAGTATTGALQAAEGVRYGAFGPLTVLVGLSPLVLALVALRLALLYRRDPSGPAARPMLLACAGFLLGALFDGASRLVALMDLLDQGQPYPWLPFGWAVTVLPAAALAPGLMTVAVLATERRFDPRPLHRIEGAVLLLAGLVVASGFARLAVAPSSDPAGHPFVLVVLGLSRLMMPVFVAWAFWDERGTPTVAVPVPSAAVPR